MCSLNIGATGRSIMLKMGVYTVSQPVGVWKFVAPRSAAQAPWRIFSISATDPGGRSLPSVTPVSVAPGSVSREAPSAVNRPTSPPARIRPTVP